MNHFQEIATASCGVSNCPTVYAVDRCGASGCPTVYEAEGSPLEVLVQGYSVSDFTTPEGETVVRVPASLLKEALEVLDRGVPATSGRAD